MKIRGHVWWTYTNSPDTQYDPCWKTTVVVTKEEKERVEEACGLKFTRLDNEEMEEKGQYSVNIRRYTKKKKKGGGFSDKDNAAPKVYMNGEEADDIGIIGYGSKAIVEFDPFAWTYKGRKGVSGDFMSINVKELVEYVGDDEEEEEKVEETKESTGEWDEDDDNF